MDLEKGVSTIEEALENLAPILRPAIPFFSEPPVEVLCRLWQTHKVKKWAEGVLKAATKCTLSQKRLPQERYLHLVWEPNVKTQTVKLSGYHIISPETKKVLDLKALVSESAKMLAPKKLDNADINQELCHFLEVNRLDPVTDIHRFQDTISASYSLHILLKQVSKWEAAKLDNGGRLADLVIAPLRRMNRSASREILRKRESNAIGAAPSAEKRSKKDDSSPEKKEKGKKNKKEKDKKENKTQGEVNI